MFYVFRNGFNTGLSSSIREVAEALARDIRQELGGRVTVWPSKR